MLKIGDYSATNDMPEARWQEVCGQTRKYWGKLSDDDLAMILSLIHI